MNPRETQIEKIRVEIEKELTAFIEKPLSITERKYKTLETLLCIAWNQPPGSYKIDVLGYRNDLYLNNEFIGEIEWDYQTIKFKPSKPVEYITVDITIKTEEE